MGPVSRRRSRTRPQAKIVARKPNHFLLDTHTFLWFVIGSHHLSPTARRIIEAPEHTIYLSAASAWEIAIKKARGKLPPHMQFPPALPVYLQRRGFHALPMSVEHAEVAGNLPNHHRDPFDRMLIAQTQLEGMTLVSNEILFDAYQIPRIW